MDADFYIGTEMRSKSELYRTLISEEKLMLPLMKIFNLENLWGIMMKTKKVKFSINVFFCNISEQPSSNDNSTLSKRLIVL